VNPFLQPMLRSGHGRKGVDHGPRGAVWWQPRAETANGSGSLEAERSVRPDLLPGRGSEPGGFRHPGIQTPMNSSVGPTGQRTRSRSPEAV